MVGREYEVGGITKHGTKMVNAVATTCVPELTVVIGGTFGADDYSMCSHAYSLRFLWTWPDTRISIMGGSQVAIALSTTRHSQIEYSGESWSQGERNKSEAPICEQFERQSHCYYSSVRLWDDGVIDPTDTRRILGMVLDIVNGVPLDEQGFGVFRI